MINQHTQENKMRSLVPVAEELVYVKAETPVTNSLKLATHFGKNHSDIIRAIKNRIRNYSELFGNRNFAEIDYLDPQGRRFRMYELTQDGFWAVVMGFTGEAAAKLQELFINEFNRRAEIIQSLKKFWPDQKSLAAPKKEYNHQYGYLQIKTTADGYSEQEWVSGAKTIKEMNDIENHSRLQHKRISLVLGNLKAFIRGLHESDRYSQRFVDLLDEIQDLADRCKPKSYGPVSAQVPMFNDDGMSNFQRESDDGGFHAAC
ncbi:MAG TPA: Rha family transcriptional regulator [Oligoflexus sp.]|uniref:Rha family transcriptional regulator n=1 Tax=Oligoflexus sp. TaxID=1971216 RepID=UPI002D362722|nr:Rha family transcriptional regulator [Oligoflexus sp.]HYX34775.1 Rha family transcriptional regulator [Oligoflexus sp.]